MNILTEKNPEIINNPGEILFTEMRNSTCSVTGHVNGIALNESELIHLLTPNESVTGIDSNFGHKTFGDAQPAKKKTSRGSKANTNIKPKKRKIQGDGSSFNCMIQFTIPGESIIPYSDTAAKKKEVIETLDIGDSKFLIIRKLYKPKLFRNGSISIPGCILEDLTDCVGPLLRLCEFLREQTSLEPEIKAINSVMRNYKFELVDKHIDLSALQDHFASKLAEYTLVSFTDVRRFIETPAFTDEIKFNPHFDSWDKYIKNVGKIPIDKHAFDFETLGVMLDESKHPKSVLIKQENLFKLINNIIPIEIYKHVAKLAFKFQEITGYYIGDNICEKIVGIVLTDELNKLNKKIIASNDNQIAGFSYDPEKFTAFIMKINSPTGDETKKKTKKQLEKQTTIKLYSGGKINIDGANNREEATYLYYWLNALLRDTPGLIYDPNVTLDDMDLDDEWSYSTSDYSYDES